MACGLATRLEPAPTPSRGARYTRAWRERGRNGEVLLRVTVDEAAFAVAAVERGLLDPLLADDRAALTAAAEKALQLFCEGSPPAPQLGDSLRDRLVDAAVRREHGRGTDDYARAMQRALERYGDEGRMTAAARASLNASLPLR